MPVINSVIMSSGGQPAPSEKYPLYSRVKDDTSTNIGTVSGYFYDGNGKKYVAVVLDNGYFTGDLLSANHQIPGLTNYYGTTVYTETETATYANNCFLAELGTSYTSVITSVRELSYYIGGVQYFAQVPNFIEMLQMASGVNKILNDSNQPIISLTNGLNSVTLSPTGTSNQYARMDIRSNGTIQHDSYTASSGSKAFYTILEIPLE